MLARLVKDDKGMATVEYAMLLALLVFIGLAGWVALGGPTRKPVEAATNYWPQG